jgi:hypothetical protein
LIMDQLLCICAILLWFVQVLDVRATSDDALPRLVEHLHQLGGTSPDSAAMQAAAEAAKAAAAASLKRKLEQQQQLEREAAAGAEEHTTPRAGRGRRNSGSAVVSPGEQPGASAVMQADTAGSRSYAELAAMDSAAAAALSLPAAVQKHFAKKQLQLQLAGANGVKAESADAAAQEQPVQSPPAAAADAVQQPAAAAVGAAMSGQLSNAATGSSGAQQQGGMEGNLQQLLGQLQAVHAVQAALASSSHQQQQEKVQPAGLSQPLGVSPLLAAAAAAGLQTPVLSALAGGLTQLPGINPILAAVLASQQAAAAASQSQPVPSAGNGNPLAAAVALLASAPAAAALMRSLANPALLAAAATSNGVGMSNGVAGAGSAQPVAAAAAVPTGSAGQPTGGSQAHALQHPQLPAATKREPSQDWVGNGHAAAVEAAAHSGELAVGNGLHQPQQQGAVSVEPSVKEEQHGSPLADVHDGNAAADA